MNTKTILVTGATGQQGGAVARQLLKQPSFAVQALTRDPAKPAARALAQAGAEVIRGDLDDPASVRRALEGAWGVFSVQNFMETGYDGEVRQGKVPGGRGQGGRGAALCVQLRWSALTATRGCRTSRANGRSSSISARAACRIRSCAPPSSCRTGTATCASRF